MNYEDFQEEMELNEQEEQPELEAVEDEPRKGKAVKDREIAGAQKTIIVFSKDDSMANVYASTPRIMQRLDFLCEQTPNHYKLENIRKNSKSQIAAKNYLVSVAMLGLLTPAESGIPAFNCGLGGRQRKAA